jgi:RING finger protein 113A
MSLFKKRKVGEKSGSRKRTTEEDIDEGETDVVKVANKPKIEVATTKLVKGEPVKDYAHNFESSSSALPSGKNDQGAAVDTADDVAMRISGTKAGPVKSSSNLRISCRFDYQPDVCKDYKDSGYCGYGDSCKFLHDRGDYKTGWQLEREYDDQQKTKQSKKLKKRNEEDDDDKGEYYVGSDSEDDGLPFVCLKCKESFVNPVSTKCKHYFCENCAIQHYKKDKRCFVCKEPTEGVFKVATEIVKKLQKNEKK